MNLEEALNCLMEDKSDLYHSIYLNHENKNSLKDAEEDIASEISAYSSIDLDGNLQFESLKFKFIIPLSSISYDIGVSEKEITDEDATNNLNVLLPDILPKTVYVYKKGKEVKFSVSLEASVESTTKDQSNYIIYCSIY
jgi:hypothetical protein